MSTIDGRPHRALAATLIVVGGILAVGGVAWFVVGLVLVIISDPFGRYLDFRPVQKT